MHDQRQLRELLEIQERRLRLVAYEIHDGLCQQLSGALGHLYAFRDLQASNHTGAQRDFDRGMHLLDQAMDEARRLIAGLQPPMLEGAGIIEAVESLLNEHRLFGGPGVEFHHALEDTLTPVLESAVFRVIQEALTNARLHSRSRRVRIELIQRKSALQITVEDWGNGFDPTRARENCYGIEGICARARLFGGQAIIDSAPNRGTRVTVELPLMQKTAHQTG